MREMERPYDNLRKTGDIKIKAYRQNGGNCRHKKVFKESIDVYRPDENGRTGQITQESPQRSAWTILVHASKITLKGRGIVKPQVVYIGKACIRDTSRLDKLYL